MRSWTEMGYGRKAPEEMMGPEETGLRASSPADD